MPLPPGVVVVWPEGGPPRRARVRTRAARPKQLPEPLIRAYSAAIRAIVDRLEAAYLEYVDRELIPALQAAGARKPGERRDEIDDRGVRAALAAIEREAVARLEREPVESTARRLATAVNQHDRDETSKQLLHALGFNLSAQEPWLEPKLQGWIQKNVSLIKSIPVKSHGQIAELTERCIRGEMDTGQLRDAIQERFRVARSRANLIATDQVLKLNADIDTERQRSFGVEKQMWVTRQDRRVRHRHRRAHRVIYPIDKPPAVGESGRRVRPGEEVQCRCKAVPITAELAPDVQALVDKELERIGRRKPPTPECEECDQQRRYLEQVWLQLEAEWKLLSGRLQLVRSQVESTAKLVAGRSPAPIGIPPNRAKQRARRTPRLRTPTDPPLLKPPPIPGQKCPECEAERQSLEFTLASLDQELKGAKAQVLAATQSAKRREKAQAVVAGGEAGSCASCDAEKVQLVAELGALDDVLARLKSQIAAHPTQKPNLPASTGQAPKAVSAVADPANGFGLPSTEVDRRAALTRYEKPLSADDYRNGLLDALDAGDLDRARDLTRHRIRQSFGAGTRSVDVLQRPEWKAGRKITASSGEGGAHSWDGSISVSSDSFGDGRDGHDAYQRREISPVWATMIHEEMHGHTAFSEDASKFSIRGAALEELVADSLAKRVHADAFPAFKYEDAHGYTEMLLKVQARVRRVMTAVEKRFVPVDEVRRRLEDVFATDIRGDVRHEKYEDRLAGFAKQLASGRGEDLEQLYSGAIEDGMKSSPQYAFLQMYYKKAGQRE